MELTIATLVHNDFPEMQECVVSLLTTPAKRYRFILLDNASEEPMENFLYDDLKPCWEGRCIGRPKYIRNRVNRYVFDGSQQIVENCSTDLLAIIHNDVQILQSGWDVEVMRLFADDPKLGLVSFFGCPAVLADGTRGGLDPGRSVGFSNLVDAEQHGLRIKKPRAMAVADGSVMILRRKMWEATGGYTPQNYQYDITVALQSLASGFRNMVAPISFLHLNGRSRFTPAYTKWMHRHFSTGDMWETQRLISAYIVRVWGPCLPLFVNQDFSFAETEPMARTPTGQDIRTYDWRAAMHQDYCMRQVGRGA